MSDGRESLDLCSAVADDLAELSLGILPGRRRSVVLAHVDHCDPCRVELEHLSVAADSVLRTAPEIEPPVGFEQRLADRMAPRPHRFGGRSRAILAVAASLLVLGTGVGIGWIAAPGGPTPSSSGPSSLPLRATASAHLMRAGEVYGRVSTLAGPPGQPGWLYMTVDQSDWKGEVSCQVVLASGPVVTVGTFWLKDGSGSWGASLPVAADRVSGARVVGPQGRVLASATFST